MKKLYIISGTMGVGKTTISQLLKIRLKNAVFLDGDWCWDSHPFQVTDETKKMVLDNICYLLNNFIRCTAYRNIIFCWVMDKQEIIDSIISRLDTSTCEVKVISLICSVEELTKRLRKDVDAGVRKIDVIENSIKRVPLYNDLNSIKIDVSNNPPEEVVDIILKL